MPSLGAIYIRDVSGHSALVDSSGNLQVNIAGGLTAGAGVSGNPVVISSGNVAIVSGTWLASGIVVNISGQNVTTTVNTTTNISGQQVYLGSGSNLVALSGAVVSISGNVVVALTSGQAVASGLWLASGINVVTTASMTSGEVHIMSGSVTLGSGGQTIGTVSIAAGGIISITSGAISVTSGSITINSGQVAVSGIFAGFSGGKFLSGAAAVSGAIPVIPMMYDTLGAQWTPFSTNISGSTILSVWQASGLVSIASGSLSVASGAISIISGEVHLMSGSVTIGAGTATIGAVSVASGIVSVASGGITVLSGGATIGTVSIGGQPITVANSGQTITAASGVVIASGIVPNISGQAVSVSGDSVVPQLGAPSMISGFGFSGALPVATAMYDFSGAKWVPLSSVTSGQNSALEVAQAPATQIRIGLSGTAVQSGLPNSSGGTALQSGDLYVITVRNVSGNADMYVGGSGSKPFSGFGFVLCGGDALTMSITNANLVYVYATTSGQFVKWIGSQF